MAYDAFVRASAFCNPARPTSSRSRYIRAHIDLDCTFPLPEPPPTRLAPRRPFSALIKKHVAKIEAEEQALARKGDVDNEATPLSPAHLRNRRAGIIVVPKKKPTNKALKGRMPLKKGIHVEDLVDHHVGMQLLRSRLNATRLTEMRVWKFDSRVSQLQKLVRDFEDEDFAGNSPLQIANELEGDARSEPRPEDGLDEIPYKIVEVSSERGGFLASNLIESRSCWQSEVNHAQEQFLTFELEVMPVPVTAIRLALVSKDVTPKNCQMLYSTRSEKGPWKLAWNFTIPEWLAHRSSGFLAKHPDPREMLRNEVPGLVAPWWRLVMLDNYGSQVCVALASPLKLYSSGGEYIHMRNHSHRETRKTTLEGMVEELAVTQGENVPPLHPVGKLHQISISYGIDLDFVQEAHAVFDGRDKTRLGLWSKQDWCEWMRDLTSAVRTSALPEERLQFFWRQLDQDSSGGLDFEEFLLFYQWCTDTARYNHKTLAEFISPIPVKAESFDPPPSGKAATSESSGLGSDATRSDDSPEATTAVPRAGYAETHKKLSAVLQAVHAANRMSVLGKPGAGQKKPVLKKMMTRQVITDSSRGESKDSLTIQNR
eukprot:TRINITY_DN58060_c0_g1_i1.p1 TRINITY_DN58060_c0_g1~~TRINITY_DN58060_c0_g1_i1.p1  ORF type:complete len:598 (-),score=91.76 TRINITY_DN58060_c0_g1_i1:37-1830(-)